jgi:TRAP-type C4-dicarboxylate transport system permease large subunit
VQVHLACRIGSALPADMMRAIWPYLAALLVGALVIAMVPGCRRRRCERAPHVKIP